MTGPWAVATALATLAIGYRLGSLHLIKHADGHLHPWCYNQIEYGFFWWRPGSWIALTYLIIFIAAHPLRSLRRIHSWREYEARQTEPAPARDPDWADKRRTTREGDDL